MKKIAYLLMIITLSAIIISCGKIDYENADNDASTQSDNSTAESQTIPVATSDEFSESNFDAIGGGDNPYRERYTIAMSSFLILDGTFTDSENYFDNEEKEKFYSTLRYYEENAPKLPLMVYLIREMGITREEYNTYLDALGVSYSDEIIDIIFSDDDVLINEIFHGPLVIYYNNELYTVYDLIKMDKTSSSTLTTEQAMTLDQIPVEKLSALLNNIKLYQEQTGDYDTGAISELCDEIAEIIADNGKAE